MKIMDMLAMVSIAFLMPMASAKTVEMNSSEILSRIHSANLEEMEAAQLANKKSSSIDVQKYAKQISKDHKKADQMVRDLASQEGVKLSDNPLPKTLNETKADIGHRVTTAELRALPPGPRFDKAFVEAMESGHKNVIAMLKSADTSDPRVKSLVATLLPKLENHERMAHKLEPQVIKQAQ